jgi:hypothetical protein
MDVNDDTHVFKRLKPSLQPHRWGEAFRPYGASYATTPATPQRLEASLRRTTH